MDGDDEELVYDTDSGSDASDYSQSDAAGEHFPKDPNFLKGCITNHGRVIKACTWHMYYY